MSSSNEHASVTSAEDWDTIDWKTARQKVKLLQHRILKSTQEGKYRKVKSLQWILSHSFYAKALAVKRVTENRGKRTAGVDGVKWTLSSQKWEAIHSLTRKGYTALPLKRVLIPKANGKKRPLSIPTFKDRAMQALHLMGLDPVSETIADPNSFGFRKGRSCADAIEQCFNALALKTSSEWILDADIEGCFDNISHQWLKENVPMDKRVLKQWLAAEIIQYNTSTRSPRGTPQGGIVSPVLANLTLNGMEEQLYRVTNTRLTKEGYKSRNPRKVNFIRYADDFIITAKDKDTLTELVLPFVNDFLEQRGLRLSAKKTRVVHISEGFDFLGHNIRKYKGKLLIKPNKAAVQDVKHKAFTIIRHNKAISQEMLIKKLNPVLRGWANFFKGSCAKQTFTSLDHDLYQSLWKWCRRRHTRKPRQWIKDRYFHTGNGRDWLFAVPEENTSLFRTETVKIQRHLKVRNQANPYDKRWWIYFEKRSRGGRVR